MVLNCSFLHFGFPSVEMTNPGYMKENRFAPPREYPTHPPQRTSSPGTPVITMKL